ncbi:MAG: hypothetical protein V1898_04355 [Patescibacteria group bacterium]
MKQLYSQKALFRNYILTENSITEEFCYEIVKQSTEISKLNNISIVVAVAKVINQKAGSGGYFWRSLLGGKYLLHNTIIAGPNCIDYAVLVKIILEKYFQINCEIKQTKLVLISQHQYILTVNNEVIDLIVGMKEFADGYFISEEIYLNQLSKINSQGIKIAGKQILAILFPPKRN